MMKTIVFLPARELKRIIILGFGSICTTAAEFALSKGIDIRVFTGPRQMHNRQSDGRLTREVLKGLGVELHVTGNIRDCVNGPYELAEPGGFVLSIGSPYLIRQDLIDLYQGRVINLHGAPLPRWRGGGGFSWRMLSGDRTGRSLFHLVTPRVDDGDIVFQRSYTFPPGVRYPSDYLVFAEKIDRESLVELLESIYEGRALNLFSQDESDATFFPRLNTALQGSIDWSWPGEAIERFVLAFSYPYEGATTFCRAKPVNLLDCRFDPSLIHDHPFFNGLVFRDHAGFIYVAVPDGTIVIEKRHIVSPENIRIGDRFHTPQELLDRALEIRPVYTPEGIREIQMPELSSHESKQEMNQGKPTQL